MSVDADVIVIGGGPAGVAAAVEIRRRGAASVILLDREPHLGGATRHCSHSPFGLREFGRPYFGAAYGRRLEEEAARAGVDVRTRHSVVRLRGDGGVDITTPRGVEQLTARRLLLGTGAREMPRSARLIAGDRPIGVVTTGTLQSYIAFHGLMPFQRPVVVGSELVTLSAILTCLTHGARPVAVLEADPQPLARAPLPLFPKLMGIPFHCGAEIVDIRGRERVEAVVVRRAGQLETLDCDGVLLTGRFTPEASLFLQSPFGVDAGSAGPAVDQQGRTADSLCFAGGNVLRAVETGGWAFREGRAIGAAIAEDLHNGPANRVSVPVGFDDPVKLVVPSLLRRSDGPPAFRDFQLRVLRRARGMLSLQLDGRTVWERRGLWLPERRILAPLPPQAVQARQVHFRFREDD